MYTPRSLHIFSFPTLRAHLARRCPFYYGWVVFAIAASTSYAARPLMSVAVLSVFMVPMTDAFEWSRWLFAAVLLMARRPEDMSLEPDPSPTRSRQPKVVTPRRLPDGRRMSDVHPRPERQFTLSQALQTRAFWILAVFSATGFLVKAGVSLHQEVSCRLIRGIDLVFELLLVVVTLLFPVRLLCRGLRKIRNFLGANSVVGKSLAPSRFTYNKVLNTL
jgi:hypothetical protein